MKQQVNQDFFLRLSEENVSPRVQKSIFFTFSGVTVVQLLQYGVTKYAAQMSRKIYTLSKSTTTATTNSNSQSSSSPSKSSSSENSKRVVKKEPNLGCARRWQHISRPGKYSTTADVPLKVLFPKNDMEKLVQFLIFDK